MILRVAHQVALAAAGAEVVELETTGTRRGNNDRVPYGIEP